MIDMETIRRLNNYDTDALIAVLELNEDRLYHWLVLGSATVARDDLDASINYVKIFRSLGHQDFNGLVDRFWRQRNSHSQEKPIGF
jgi:hypothetical protein